MIKKITERFTAKHYVAELVLILLALFGFYLVVAWSGYSPFDSAWSVSTYQTTTINKAGFLGAWIIDVFFSLFGHIGNIIPFMLLIMALNGIRIKKYKLSWSKAILLILGLILLFCGLTSASTLLLNNSQYYLSGGVLGSFLFMTLEPLIGKFGLVIFALICSIVGFILCSGASLVLILVRFYHWLTVKNTTDDVSVEDTSSQQEEIQQSQPAQNDNLDSLVDIRGLSRSYTNVDLSAQSLASSSVTITESVPLSIKTNIDSNQLESNTPFVSEQQFKPYDLEQNSELPKVSIQPRSEYITTSALNIDSNALNPTNVGFDLGSLEIPTVSLQNSECSEPVIGLEQYEQARPEQSLKQKIVLEQTNPEQNEPNPPQQDTPNYKPYSQTLIHPFLQPKTTVRAKPTTPFPSLDLLDSRTTEVRKITREEIMHTSERIEQQLRNFNIKATVRDVLVGPVVTRYELELQPGVKASKVTSIDTDLARALMFRSIRVAEVIPGKPYIGIETPNAQRQVVPLRDVLDSEEFSSSKSLLCMALGKDISGKPVVVDLAKMPHLLVAGSTGSGKSVGVNTMILSLLYRVKPEEVKFIMIDPKVVELSVYNDIPHLLTEVVTDMKKAANALRWCVEEMERRYQLLSALRVRNIEGYNEKIDEAAAMGLPIPNPIWRPGDSMDSMPPSLEKLSYIVVIVDEFADLMMVAGKQVEELIARLAQKARAIGIHLILATQRPSVDVITGLIKANIPSRIAFTVASKIDSRTILDQGGAESLLGRGDMLYSGQGSSDLIRVHGAFMTDDEVVRIADDWRARGKPEYIESILQSAEDENDDSNELDSGELDELFDEVVEFVISTGTTSTSSVQRRFRIGFNRAARIMEQLEEQGIVSAMQNGKREVLSRSFDY